MLNSFNTKNNAKGHAVTSSGAGGKSVPLVSQRASPLGLGGALTSLGGALISFGGTLVMS